MSLIRFEDVTLGWDGGPHVLSDLEFTLGQGWTGLVGANGSGKSTLLCAVAADAADAAINRPMIRSGRVVRDPGGACVVQVHQRVAKISRLVEEFAWTYDTDALRWRSLLALEDDQPARWPTLSPGQRRRWQLAAALHARPHVLLVDEPANHLDSDARERLLVALRAFRGVGVLVSHDRVLLDELCTSTLRVAHGHATLYGARHRDARKEWQQAEEAARTRSEEASQMLRSAKRARAARLEALKSAERGRNAGRRMNGPKDSDARSTAAKVRADHGATIAARSAGRLGSEVLRAAAAAAAARAPQSHHVELRIRGERPRVQHVAHVNEAVVYAGEHPVLHDVDLRVPKDARWRIRGANGAGKSTLIRALLRGLHVPRTRVLYLGQGEGDEATVETAIKTLDAETRGRVFRVAGAMGVDIDAAMHAPVWSPGMARKLALALSVERDVWLIVLDEPTNHLDLPAREALEKSLAGYEGALLVVTHDDAFAKAVAHQDVWVRRGRVFGPMDG